MKKQFKAREGSPFRQEEAQQVGEELELIKEKEGSLTPELVVKNAKKKGNFLNKFFEWDDSKASEKWRLQQARMIVNHIIEVTIIRGEETEVRSFFNVVTDEGNTEYVSRNEAISIKPYREQLLEQMETTMKNLLGLIRMFRQGE